MFNFFKKKEEKFPINQDVSFSVALEALKKGYLIKHANYDDVFLLMINGRVFYIQDRPDSLNEEVKELDIFNIMLDTWRILKNIR